MQSRLFRTGVRLVPSRGFVMESIRDILKRKELAEEDIYMSKKDKEAIRKQMEKLKQQEMEMQEELRVKDEDRRKLIQILRENNARLPDHTIESILKWKSGEI